MFSSNGLSQNAPSFQTFTGHCLWRTGWVLVFFVLKTVDRVLIVSRFVSLGNKYFWLSFSFSWSANIPHRKSLPKKYFYNGDCATGIKSVGHISQIAKTLGSTSIRHQSNAKVSDRCLIDIDLRVCVIWDGFTVSRIDLANTYLMDIFVTYSPIADVLAKHEMCISYKHIYIEQMKP